MPLGTIINKINEKQLVDTEKIQRLYKINSIYRMTKHDYEYNEYMDEPESDMGSQRFNNLEALAMYFICRKVGVEILSEMPQY